MDSNVCSITNIRDFLVNLPRLAKYDYNEAVSYLLWKILNLSIEHGDKVIDWKSFVCLLESDNWRNGTYQRLIKGSSWKKMALKSARKSNVHVGTMCNRQCYPAETVYYCFTCTMNPLYEICEYCFDRSKHEGHVYTAKIVTRPEGRVCHCGNTSIFKEPHCINQCKNELNNVLPESTAPSNSPDENVHSTVSTLFDYLIDVIIYFKEHDDCVDSMGNEKCGGAKVDGTVKAETHLTDSKGNIIDSSLDANTEWALQIDEEDCQMHYMDLATKISRILNKPAEYAISVTSALENGCSSVTVVKSPDRKKIEKVSKEFQNEGAKNHIRETKDTFKKSLIDDIVFWLYFLCINETTPMAYKNAIRLSILDAWNPRLLSNKFTATGLSPYMAKINLLGGFLVSYEQRDTFPWFKPWRFSEVIDPMVGKVMSNYDKRLADTNIPNTVSRFHTFHGSRFQYILTESTDFFSRLARYRMLKVISSVFTITDESRKCLAAQYLDVYLAVLYSTVASDNTGFKVSLMGTISQYVFQDPETANLAIKRGFIQRTLRFAFTLMAFTSEDLMAFLPIPLYHGCKLPSESIRNRRTIVCFKDICILMSTNTIPQFLLEDESILAAIVESFAQFNKILPLKRETSEHVEFENFDFSSYYFFFSSILIMTDGYVRSISLLSDKERRRKIVTKLVLIAMDKEFELLSHFRKSSSPLSLIDGSTDGGKTWGFPVVKEKICNYVANVIYFQVGVDTQNFFNPMSYLFKFILQWSYCGRYVPLPDYMENYLDFNELFPDKTRALHISESALSTLVLLGQINVGFWVRNGTPITHQARMYTKYSMREFTYMSDIFNVQFSMSRAEPNEFIVTYLARWGLKHWANGFPMGDYPDFETTVAVVTQCFLLLVQLLTETKFLTIVSSVDGFQKTLRAEIVHALCFKSCTYSQIMSCIPEHITKHAAFDLYLEEYTNFTPPSGLTDCGVYSLKQEYRAEIDPYYVGLSSSKRYEVEKDIRMSMAMKEKLDYDDTFVPARKVIDFLRPTPYCNLFAISSVETFGVFLKNTLDHIKKFECETLLPVVIHLIHLCVVNNLNAFVKIFWHEFDSVDTEFYYYHSIGSILYEFLLKENFSQVHGKIREIFRYMVKKAPHVDANSYLQEQALSFNPEILWSSSKMRSSKDGEAERKKNLARQRREKVMKKLAKQQMQFIGNNSLSTSDEESCKESSAEPSACTQPVGWEFPEDPCVFCKMPCEDDVFIYFSYQEESICDHGIDFTKFNATKSNEDSKLSTECRLQLTHQAAVLRTCGHGSHISCLASHMKSIRAAHNQTTKNVPVAYGFGLMYCPLCNGLCNSFLPQLKRINSRRADDYFEGRPLSAPHESSVLLISTSVKAARIFQDLFRRPSDSGEGLINVVNQLLVNTTCNIELSIRSAAKFSFHSISSQRLLTLRLIADLRDFLQEQSADDTTCHEALPDRNQFICERIDSELLLSGSHSLEPPMKAETHTDPTGNIHEVLKRKIYQSLLQLAKELIKVGFYKNCSKEAPWNIQKDLITAGREEEVRYIACIFEAMTDCLDPVAGFHAAQQPKLHQYVHHLLIQSLTVFLKRLCIIFHAQYAVETRHKPYSTFARHLDFFLSYLKLSPLENLLRKFYEDDLDNLLEITKFAFTGDNAQKTAMKLDALTYVCAEPAQLISLPKSLSTFFLLEDDNIRHRALRDDIAICLFCGKSCHIQKSVALHGYSIGVCTNHVRNECPVISTYGVFLLIRSNAILLSYGQRGSFYQAPYLHKHGEPDEDFKYNSPVFLDQRRYEHLMNGVVLENMIPHLVFRLTDSNSDIGGWETM